ncbi:MAG: lytic transglycosylase domain-containing protein [Paracoccaceae bacterium]
MRLRLACIVAVSLALAVPAQAQTLSTTSRASLFASQLSVLDDRAASQYSGSARLLPPRVELPEVEVVVAPARIPAFTGRYRGPYLDLARAAARRHGIPEDLFLRLVQQESAWNSAAISHAGAIGLAQLMPGTARLLRVDPRDPAQNLDGGARYLMAQFRTFGDWRLALAAYNAGPGAVQQHGGIPPFRETRDYVRRIMGS